MAINKKWHLANRMPKNPTEGQRAIWHIEHAKHCQCRKPSVKEQELIDKYKSSTANPDQKVDQPNSK